MRLNVPAPADGAPSGELLSATLRGPVDFLKVASQRVQHPFFPPSAPVGPESGADRLAIVMGLGSEAPEANSLFEFLVYQLHDAAVRRGTPANLGQLLQRLEGSCSTADLLDFAARAGLDQHFALPGGETAKIHEIPGLFVKAIEAKKREVRPLALASSTAYQLGYRYVFEVFSNALADSAYSKEIAHALVAAARGPLPLLWIHRLFHVLQSRDFEFKVLEFFSGSTAFVEHPALAEVLRRVDEEARRAMSGELASRRRHWIVESLKVWDKHGRLDHLLLADLLEIRPTSASRRLASLLREERIGLRVFSREQFRDYVKGRSRDRAAKILFEVDATYQLPAGDGDRPTIILLRLEETDSDEALALSLLDRAETADHEGGIHVMQAEREGNDLWPVCDVMTAEMEAHAESTLFRLKNGYDDFYRIASRLSPYGYAMGLRNWIEQIYYRQDPLP